MRRVLLASLLIAVAALSSGCYEFQTFVHSPFGPGTLCDPTHCCGCSGPCDCGPCDAGPCGPGPGCGPCGAPYFGTWGFGPTWGCGPAAYCGPACGPGAGCGDCCGIGPGAACADGGVACDPCTGYGCNCGCGCGPGPLYHVMKLFHPLRWFGCYNNGCGEVYWGDFHGDPPDCCDPCNRMGQFTGGTSACGGCGSCGGCATPSFANHGVPAQETTVPSSDIDPSRPTQQPTKAPVVPSKNPYYSGRRYHQNRARF